MGRNRRGSHARLIKKCKASVKACPIGEKPKGVKTHLRNMVITPDMVGSVVECYLGEFSLTYKPIRHGKVGHGATRGSKFTALRLTLKVLCSISYGHELLPRTWPRAN